MIVDPLTKHLEEVSLSSKNTFESLEIDIHESQTSLEMLNNMVQVVHTLVLEILIQFLETSYILRILIEIGDDSLIHL